MTTQEIIALGQEAAGAAIDAHGLGNTPSADVAFAFVQQLAFDDENIAELALTEDEMPVFRAAYKTYIAEAVCSLGRRDAS